MKPPIGDAIQEGLEALERTNKYGAPLHEMPREATSLLARYGIYTTTEPRNPGGWFAFRRYKKYERAHDKLADNLTRLLRDSASYREAIEDNMLGQKLVGVLSHVTGYTASNVRLLDQKTRRDGSEDGTVVADSITYSVDHASCHDLATLLQAMERRIGSRFRPVHTDTRGVEAQVQVYDRSEHDPRSLGRAVGAIVAREDRRPKERWDRGVVLPPDKSQFSVWEERGETFPPHMRDRIEAVIAAYNLMTKDVTYIDPKYPDRIQPTHYPQPIGTDVAAILQAERDGFSGRIDEFREGGNPEQNPNKKMRPWIEKGVNIKRPKKKKADERGPAMPHTPSMLEWIADVGNSTLLYARKHKVRAALAAGEHIIKAVGSGFLDIALAGVRLVPKLFVAGWRWGSDVREWRAQKHDFAESTRRVNLLLESLRAPSHIEVLQKP